jgi:FAD/FMN-containing dehydrogenase
VIDLSPMKGVAIGPASASVRAQGGLTWAELDGATQAAGLATTGGLVSSTGVAGFTLGGGIGWLMRKHGLACDNLIGAEVVTADGRVLRVSESEHADLLWGLRGGGGNFGVVTEFELRLHPVGPLVLGGMLAWPADRAGDVLRVWREWARDTPEELCTLAVFVYAPPEPFVPPELQGTPIFAIAACHLDPDRAGDLRTLRELGPAVDVLGPMPYTALQGMFDAGAPAGQQNYWKSAYVADLDDGAIDVLVAQATGIPAPFGALHVHQLGGAMSRVPAGATAMGHREAGFLVNVVGLWPDPAENERHTAWARATAAALEPFATGAYVNFMGEEGQARVHAAYEPASFARLQALKAAYDPTNFFRLNQNITPS